MAPDSCDSAVPPKSMILRAFGSDRMKEDRPAWMDGPNASGGNAIRVRNSSEARMSATIWRLDPPPARKFVKLPRPCWSGSRLSKTSKANRTAEASEALKKETGRNGSAFRQSPAPCWCTFRPRDRVIEGTGGSLLDSRSTPGNLPAPLDCRGVGGLSPGHYTARRQCSTPELTRGV